MLPSHDRVKVERGTKPVRTTDKRRQTQSGPQRKKKRFGRDSGSKENPPREAREKFKACLRKEKKIKSILI